MTAPRSKIFVLHADHELGRYTVEPGEYTIGRASASSIQIKVGPVSRVHARLLVSPSGAITVEDLGSANGTQLDGRPITSPTPWRPGQILGIGDARLQVESISEDQPFDELAPTLAQSSVEGAPAINPNASPPFIQPHGLGADETSLISRHLSLVPREAQRLDVGKEVARGGMGAVVEARESATRRTVAMKFMLRGGEAKSTLRFIEEAQVTAQLEHPNIPPVHDLGIDPNGQPFYTMKLIAGITLKKVLELLKERRAETIAKYPLPALLTIFQKVCDGLAFAHSRGVIHRDLKPANIMIGKFGEVLVMDWGLAKVIGRVRSQEGTSHAIGEVTVDSARREDADEFSTLGGSVMGTPHYMSPEQARGEIESLDQRSDVFSLGVMLFEMLTLEKPFQGETAAHIIANICAGQFVPASQLVSMQARSGSGKVPPVLPHLPAGRVPKSLDAVVLKAMSLDRHARYGSVKELQADLNAYQTGFATQAEGTNAWNQIRLLVKRNLPASIGIAAVLVISTVLGTGAIIQGKRAKEALIALKKTAPALRRLADTEASLQQFDSALEKLDAAIVLDPGYLPSYWRRAWLLIGKEDYAASAAAIRMARARDGSHPEWANILSVVEALANAPNESRWTPERAESVYRHLNSVNAAGETSALSASMRLGSREKAELVINRLQQWFGGGGKIDVTVSRSGLIAVRARGEAVQSLAPFHGLSINSLDLAGSPAPDLEPLRGMPLVHLILGTKVQSLEPLRGMQLKELDASGAALTDVSALQGMPLEKLLLVGASLQNLSFLSGAPLRELGIERCGVTDLSPLRGAPLVSLGAGQNPIVNLQPLSQAPLESLDISNTAVADLRPLRGLPLKRLIASRSKIADLSALKGAPLITLDVSHCPIQDYSPLLSIASLEKLVVSGRSSGIEVLRSHPALRQIQLKNDGETVQPLAPVTEFWTRYDARKAALK